ncbi:MAG: hypothetical protein FWH34_05025 [Desulfovibrionaceae bacterium]|nr:hypothetical protein [Desulfovibrionaceae bacterium]
MIIVDLQDLENRARMTSESIGGVVLEPEAVLLIVSEIRRMKAALNEDHSHLTGMRDELLQLRTELINSITRSQTSQRPAKPKKNTKMLKMRVVKDSKDDGGAKN